MYSPIRVVELLPERALFLEETAALCLMPVHERIMAAAEARGVVCGARLWSAINERSSVAEH